MSVEQELALTRARLNEAQRIVRLGSWSWDLKANTHWWSDELYRILEVQPDTEQSPFDRFCSMVHPQDRARLEDVSARTLAGEDTTPVEVRIRLASGEERIIQTGGRLARDPCGQSLVAHGTLQDVTAQRQTESALRRTELRYRETQRLAKMGNWEWDMATGTSWWSEELYRILEVDPVTFPSTFENFLSLVHPADRGEMAARQARIAAGGEVPNSLDIRLLLRSGREKIIQNRAKQRVNEDGTPVAVFGTIHDITERLTLTSLLRETEARYASTVELAAVGIAHVDPAGCFIWSNSALHDMLGYTRQELERRTVHEISHPEDRHVTDRGRSQMHAGALESLRTEKRYLRKDGQVIWVKITSAPRRAERGQLLYDISVIEDITPRKLAEERVQYLANHDELTGLPNRTLFSEILVRTIDAARRAAGGCALLFVDLDRFKIINDSLGHEAGDLLLQEVAQRIRRAVRETDIVARFGGDEFVVLLPDLHEKMTIAASARRLLATVAEPVNIKGLDCRVTASIGIARYPLDATDGSTLMQHADVAMYAAKNEGKNNFQFHRTTRATMSVERIVLETQLIHALERDEFALHYQPKIETATGRIAGVEALLRWRNPQLGAVAPGDFIPLAEETGLIVPIGEWVLRTACAQAVAWERRGLPALAMAVNLSPRQFKDPQLVRRVSEALRASGLASTRLELEITEGMIMNSMEEAARAATLIKRLGVRLAIDDFGTGYSSLSQLKRFPIDTLKIDRSFIRELPQDAQDMAIIQAIIALGKALGVTVIAEGVETTAQANFLREQSCCETQGFLHGQPCDAETFAQRFWQLDSSADSTAVRLGIAEATYSSGRKLRAEEA